MNASQLCEPILSFSCFIIYRSQSNSQTKANDYKYRVRLIRCAHVPVRVHVTYIFNVHVNAVCLKLWRLLSPDTVLQSRVSKQWADIGFQGDDPATDFRGMGLLSLHNLM